MNPIAMLAEIALSWTLGIFVAFGLILVGVVICLFAVALMRSNRPAFPAATTPDQDEAISRQINAPEAPKPEPDPRDNIEGELLARDFMRRNPGLVPKSPTGIRNRESGIRDQDEDQD